MQRRGRASWLLAASLALCVPTFVQPSASVSLEKAREYLEAHEFNLAFATAMEVVDKEPKNAPAHLVAGAAALRLGRLEAAERLLRRSSDLDPKLGLVRFQLGLLAIERATIETRAAARERYYAKAAEWFAKELSASPGLCEALEARTNALIAAERSIAASGAIEDWVAACPTAAEAWHLRARNLIGNSEWRRLESLPDLVPADLPGIRTDMLWFVASGNLLSGNPDRAKRTLEAIANDESREPERVAAAAAARALRGSYDDVAGALELLLHARHLDSYSIDEPLLVLGLSALDAPEGTVPGFTLMDSGKTLVPNVGDPNLEREMTMPVLLHKQPPEYPEKLRRAGVSGTVVLLGIVTKAGRVVPIRVERASHSDFVGSAIHSVVRWRYAPAVLRGTPMDVTYVFRIDFRLGGS